MKRANKIPLFSAFKATKALAMLTVAALLTVNSLNVFAAIEQRKFDDPSHADRYASLIAELRCLVCQNQNLADSNAELAKDLRDKTAEMLIAGNSDQEILDFMSDRYGDFILYRPPFRADTAALWLGPLALLLLVIILLFRHILKKQREQSLTPTQSWDEAERIKARNLMKDSPRLDQPKDSKK